MLDIAYNVALKNYIYKRAIHVICHAHAVLASTYITSVIVLDDKHL